MNQPTYMQICTSKGRAELVQQSTDPNTGDGINVCTSDLIYNNSKDMRAARESSVVVTYLIKNLAQSINADLEAWFAL